ncbi:two component transcriptional regulator, LytTR family [Chryseolinea serpens]|jgi:DNA-binding LytR/AlgR family response regulator|uniref:Two component transcriptional regulator, LytTR family n=1 Tax=Chryseolinea serpens TaxID=947013 RepID=A0A1M5WUG8_9BACT|nr:LytTR family DNA-binding domain-containing protein [Chryseolinea serpens]SHH91052.1 two component transcriptional regulator, LytTR family [Chryseolinea serpens]
MTKLNCLIVDDEPVARKGLEEHMQAIDFLHCVASCEDALKAASYVNEQKIDLMYLDIHMPKVTGIDFLKMLKNPPITILTTAYPDYAVEGYSLDVMDYLVKPITFERFLKASQKAMEYFQLKLRAGQNGAPEVDYYFVRCDRKFEKVFFRDIAYVEGMQNYVILHIGDRKLITYITLTSLEDQMPKDQFLRVHKSFLISLPHVKAIEGDEIILENARIPIGRTLREQVVQRIIGTYLFKR